MSPVDKLNISSTAQASRLSTTPLTPTGNIVDMQGAIHQGIPLASDEAGQIGQEENPPATTTNEKAENEEMTQESTETERHSSINGHEDTQSTSCVIINVDLENSAYDYGDGDGSSVLSSKTCSVEDISLAGVQEGVKATTETNSCDEKVMSEVSSEAVLEELKQEPEIAGTEDDVTSAKIPKLSNESSSVSVEEEEEEEAAGVKQGESQEYVNPRGVRFMSQEVGHDGE